MQELAEHQDQERHVKEYLSVIRRRWKSAFILFSLIFFGVLGYTYWVTPVYEAQSTVRVTTNKPTLTVPWESTNPLEAEIEIIRSRTVAEKVVERLHLDWQVEKKAKGISFRLLEFTLNPPLRSLLVELTGDQRFNVRDAEGKLLASGQAGTPLRHQEFSLHFVDLKGQAGDRVVLRHLAVTTVAQRIRGKLVAKIPPGASEKDNIFYLTYRDADPVKARDILNTVVAAYMEKTVDFKSAEADKSIEFLDAQMNNIRAELENSEKKLEEYKTSAGIFTLDSEAQLLFQKLALSDQQRSELGQQRKLLEFAVSSVRDARAKGKAYYPGDPVGMTAMVKMEELDSQKRALLSEFTPDHPQVRAVQAQIDEQLRQLLLIYQSALSGIDEKKAFLQGKLAEEESGLHRLPETERELLKLMRVTKVNSDIFSFLLQKYEEARLAKASTTGNANIIDSAITPLSPVKPEKMKNILFGLILGLFSGVGFAFFREYLDDTIKDAEIARREVGTPVLAVVPRIEVEKGGNPLVVCTDPKSPAAETFRGLRTSIHFSAINKQKQVLLVTSSFAGEGKTTVIANLASVYVQAGARTLLIDCDLRRPSVHALFSAPRVPGVADILAGDISWKDVVQHSTVAGLDYLPAGTTPPNPVELLGSESMSGLLAELREQYDSIFIDAPPVLAVTDAPVLTTLSDLVLLVIETGRVPVKAARRMAEVLESARAPVVGIVVNDKSGTSLERYGYYGYRYYGEEDSGAGTGASRWRSGWKRLTKKGRRQDMPGA